MWRKKLTTWIGITSLLAMAAMGASGQTDWLTHRGGNLRPGGNGDSGITNANQQLGFVYKYPATGTMPPEIVVDNSTLPPPAATATGQQFTVSGAWNYATTDGTGANVRAPGAWPPADANTAKIADYVYTTAQYSAILANATLTDPLTGQVISTGLSTLQRLPDLGTDVNSSALYSAINAALVASEGTSAHWVFGTQYPVGTHQANTDVSSQPLAPNQRYAIYIRYPGSGTIANSQTLANVDHVMVRVSWGASGPADPMVDDPVTSRIFMLNFGQTGGFWLRIRTGAGDDRYFPYDGVHPLIVTLYAVTPDSTSGAIVPADAVRLVPEAMRGDIHAAPVSALYPRDTVDTNFPNAHMQLTYFGRDETNGPAVLFPNTLNPGSPSGFTPILLNPTLAPDPVNNPAVADPTTSIRFAAFYCIEDDYADVYNPPVQNYGVLRWRYEAHPSLPTYAVDNSDPGATYSPNPGPPDWTIVAANTTNQAYGADYRTTPAVLTETAAFTWKTTVPAANVNDSTTYSVYAWIPAAEPMPGGTPYATAAQYRITTSGGVSTFTLNQQNSPNQGTWRLLAAHIRFPATQGNTLSQDVQVVLSNAASQDDVTNNRIVAADAIEVVAENQTANSVMASPLLVHNVAWPSGKKHDVVYFATTDGHVWALDALGGNGTTIPYWVYPSVSNPLMPNGLIRGPQDDPNYRPDLYNLQGLTGTDGRTDGGLYATDGDLSPMPDTQLNSVNPNGTYAVVNGVPPMGSFLSSPTYVQVKQGTQTIPYIVVGNQSGRVYAFDPTGRTVENPNMVNETVGDPYKATLVNHIAGTGRRLMTWPSVGRDKWLDSLDIEYADDSDGAPIFTARGFTPVNPANANAMANKGTYFTAPAVDPQRARVLTATWKKYVTPPPGVTAYSIFVWIPADLNTNFAHAANYIISTPSGQVNVTLDQRNVLNPDQAAYAPRGEWRYLTGNIPVSSDNGGTYMQVQLSNGSAADATAGRIVAADAVEFVSDLPTNIVTGDDSDAPPDFTPLPGRSVFTSATANVSYNGVDFSYLTAPETVGTPTISANWKKVLHPPSGINQYTVFAWIPNDALNKFATNAHYQILTSTGPVDVYIDQHGYNPPASGNRWVQLKSGVVFPVDANNNYIGTVSLLNDGSAGDVQSNYVIAADAVKFVSLSAGAPVDEIAKGAFPSSPTVYNDGTSDDWLIEGCGDGNVYGIDVLNNNPHVRISNLLAGGASAGLPRWVFPVPNNDPVLQPGVLTTDAPPTDNFIFTAGLHVYSITNPLIASGGTPVQNWVFSPSVQENFSAPAWITGNAKVNGSKSTVFISNMNGEVFEVDSSTGTEKWESSTYGATRAPVTFLSSLPYQPYVNGYPAVVPAVVLPLDTGAIIGLDASDNSGNGKLVWTFQDGMIGNVPLIVDSSGTIQQFSTSSVWRGSEAITPNMWVYNSDEGNQDNGEVNGQLHAYFNSTYTNNYIPPNEIPVQPPAPGNKLEGVDIRIAQVWDSTTDVAASPWNNLGNAGGVSMYDAWRTGKFKQDTFYNNNDSHFVVYEWGDTVYAAAWGGYRGVKNGALDPGNLPQVTFVLSGGGQNQTQNVQATQDKAMPDGTIQVFVPGDPTDSNPADQVPQWLPGYAWQAKASFQIGKGSQVFAQTPGSIYNVSVMARQTSSTTAPGQPAIITPTIQLAAGQYTLTTPNFTDGSGTHPNPPEYYSSPLPLPPTNTLFGAMRDLTLANPLAITTRGPATAGQPDELGWDPASQGNFNNVFLEVMANGNRLINDPSTGTPGTLTVSGLKDIVAPMGFISHGTGSIYKGVTSAGAPQSSVFAIADRSNLYKLGQSLSNLRVQRHDLRWNYKNGDTSYGAMNPLPWEDLSKVASHSSVDYPDISGLNVTVRPSSTTLDMTQQPVNLPAASFNSTTKVKTLNWTSLDLVVNVPQYQPANITTAYYGINDLTHTSASPPDMYAPMNTSSGLPTSPTDPAAIRLMIAPSSGYVGSYIVFVDTSGNGVFQGSAALPGVQSTQQPNLNNEMAFRQFNVGVAVPPDLNINTQEQTIDLGELPQSTGYSPWAGNNTYQLPFAPSGVGPYRGTVSPWDDPNGQRFFAPFTVKNNGNVNLIDLRVAKEMGASNVAPATPSCWVTLSSDQVPISTGVGTLLGPAFNALGAPAMGNLGIISSLDHMNAAHSITWDSISNMWPIPNPNWPSGNQTAPTLHKPRVGSSSASVMFLADGPSGSQFGDKPRIGVAIPMGTPVGTYSAPIYIYEDEIPAQWRQWVTNFSTWNSLSNPLNGAVDDDGILNTPMNGLLPTMPPIEAAVSNPFVLKLTVTEARLTNGASAGAWNQLDVRSPGDPPNGANIMPAVMMNNNPSKNDIYLYWPSNRVLNNGKWQEPLSQVAPFGPDPNAPWYLFYSKLASASNGSVFDWQFAPGGASWWNAIGGPIPSAAPAGDIPESVRNYSPYLTQDQTTGISWLFWEFSAYKTAAGGNGGPVQDLATYYTPLKNGAPDPAFNNGNAMGFATDQSLPKYAPKAVVNNKESWVFWYSGQQGKTRLYYNHKTDLTNTTAAWDPDKLLPTPGTLVWQSDPIPVWRTVNGQTFIDLIYSGILPNRRQAEVFLTRYTVNAGTLTVLSLPPVTGEILARDGNTQTWYSRDIFWQSASSNPQFAIYVNGTQVNAPGNGNYDSATGKFYWNNPTGGQIMVDPQAGMVTFTGRAPGPNDVVTANYIPQTMRLSVTRNDLPVTAPSGSNVGDSAFLDSAMPDEHPEAVFGVGNNSLPAGSMNVWRYWLFYRKTGTDVTAPAQVYYKTMRLMVRLNHGVLRNLDGTINGTEGNNITVQGNLGPYEVDWVRGRVYFTPIDEGNHVTITYNWQRSQDTSSPPNVTTSTDTVNGQVKWEDEISAAITPGDQTTNEAVLPTHLAVNEGEISAFKDPFQNKVWVFWVSSRNGLSDLYYMTISPQFYPVVAQ